MNFLLTFQSVAILLVYAIPGYLLIKCKVLKPEHIASFSTVLLYICLPSQSLYSFQVTDFTVELFIQMLIFFALAILAELIMLALIWFMYRKKNDVGHKVVIVASAFGNVGFLGVPLVEALLPEYPEAVCFSAVFMVVLNLLAWTAGLFIMTGDKKFLSIKKVFLNPQMLILIVALPLFFTNTKLPEPLFNAIDIMGKGTTFLCMLILGMRFATVNKKKVFTDIKNYIGSFLKLIAFPSVAFLISFALPIDSNIIKVLFILSCCPTASIVHNLAEIHRTGQQEASNLVLTSTLFSIVIIPIMLLLI